MTELETRKPTCKMQLYDGELDSIVRLTLSGRPYSALYRRSLVVPRLPFLNTCSDDSKPYMILKALDESYKNHIGFAIIRASGEEQ